MQFYCNNFLTIAIIYLSTLQLYTFKISFSDLGAFRKISVKNWNHYCRRFYLKLTSALPSIIIL